MRHFLFIFLLVSSILSGCNDPDRESKVPPSSVSLKKEIIRQAERQLKEKNYPFTLVLNGDIRFDGEQRGKDWVIRSEKTEEKPISIEKKGKEIRLTRDGHTEKLDQRQFGLLSPRDHLSLLREAAVWTKALPDRQAEAREMRGIEAELDNDRLGEKLGHWMGRAYEDGPAFRASRNFRLRYRLWYHPDTRETEELTIRIVPLQGGGKPEQVSYRF